MRAAGARATRGPSSRPDESRRRANEGEPMFVTPLYTGVLVLLFLILSARVVGARGRGDISIGDGSDPKMLRVIRGHANFAEYVPLALLMMAMLELTHFSIYVLHVLGIVLVIARVLHGWALSFT